MTTCHSCGASAPETASWCGQCYQRLAPTTGAATPAADAQGDVLGAPDRFGIVRQPTPAGMDADTAAGPVSTLAPPTRWQPPAPAPTGPLEGPRTGTLGAWGTGSTGYTVIGAILLGGLLQLIFFAIGKNGHVEPEAFVRYAIVGTVTFYCIVAVVVAHRVFNGGVRLVWTQGPPLLSGATGAAIGISLGIGLVALMSAAQHHLATDSNAQLIASEGDIAHVAALVLITVVAAPLVEETLFRGLFAESLRAKGTGFAIWISAVAFAFWHWPILQSNTAAFVFQTGYYTLMGAMLARLYWRGGLVRSMAAHAGFNGTLTVVAIALALSPGHLVHGDGFQLSAPGGWHEHSDAHVGVPGGVLLVGPSDASVFFMEEPTGGRRVSPDDLVQRFSSGGIAGFSAYGNVVGQPTEEELPAGTAVEVDLTVQGHKGALVMLPAGGNVLVIAFGSSGSVKAEQDFHKMLQSLEVG